MLKIGLMGFEFDSPNKGCQALAYSVTLLINNIFKEKDITFYVFNSKVDTISHLFPNIKFISVKNKLKDIKFVWIRTIAKCDCVLDVTMGDSFSDIYSRRYCSRLIRDKRIVEFFNKNYVLMPQTYGPFNDDGIKRKALKVINKAKAVISRDRVSIDYLKELGVKREIKENIDLAFALPFSNEYFFEGKKAKKLGINVSGLLWKGGFHGNTNQFNLKMDYRQYIKDLLRYYYESDWEIHLIPHVVDLSECSHDDDYKTLIELHREFPKTILAPAFENPIDAKSYISKMDCFIGARMHSTVAAFSSGVAVIPVTYSRKFKGLFSSLGYDYLIHGDLFSTNEALKRTIDYIGISDALKQEVLNKQILIQQKLSDLENVLLTLINGFSK